VQDDEGDGPERWMPNAGRASELKQFRLEHEGICTIRPLTTQCPSFSVDEASKEWNMHSSTVHGNFPWLPYACRRHVPEHGRYQQPAFPL